jgi:hypothetical protein
MYKVGDVFEDTYSVTGGHLISVIDAIIHFEDDDSWKYVMRSVNKLEWMDGLITPSIEDRSFTYYMTPNYLELNAKLLNV